ncbi:hypothetical protein FM106_27015 [Brachybacterium faecium]|nr:hypothetical protein FM106_27015 [Brachybacterium faecium]
MKVKANVQLQRNWRKHYFDVICQDSVFEILQELFVFK